MVALPKQDSLGRHQTASNRWLCVAGLMIAMAKETKTN
jgi:hypothetical protein